MNLNNYLGLKYCEPYDCFELVEAVRTDLGLKTPYMGQYNGCLSTAIRLLRENKINWKARTYLHKGEIGDVVLTSNVRFLPYHHCGVVISDSEMIHILPESQVTAMKLSELFYHFAGGACRYFYED